MALEQRVKEVIGECFQVDWRNIKNTDRFKEDLGADSLDLTDLSFRLERKFEHVKKLNITKAEEECFVSVQDILNYLLNEELEP